MWQARPAERNGRSRTLISHQAKHTWANQSAGLVWSGLVWLGSITKQYIRLNDNIIMNENCCWEGSFGLLNKQLKAHNNMYNHDPANDD